MYFVLFFPVLLCAHYVFRIIQNLLWQFAAGSGYDMMEVQYGLIDLFEEGAANGKYVLEVTGEDVAAFVDRKSVV